jgi:sulfofructose kinase
MTENPVVAFVGIATIDMIFGVETLPEGPTKNFAHCYREVAGGVAARAAMTAAKLGANTRMIGRIGDDDAGEMLRRTLERVGVDCHFLTPVPGRTTPVSAIFVDRDRQRMLVNYKDAELFAGAELPKGALNGVDAVMCDLRWPPGAMTALDVASRMGVPGVLDFDKSPERGTHRLINRASHVVFGEEALCGLTAGADLGARLARVAGHNPGRNFAVTAGEKGVVWRSASDRTGHIPALEVEEVATLGAGDAFHGAAAFALAEGRSFEEALRFANAAAGLKVSRPNEPRHLPTLAEVDALMESA